MLLVVAVASIVLAVVLGAWAWRLAGLERIRSEARVTALAAAIEGTSNAAPAAMFERAPRSGVQGRPLLKLGVGFVMAVGVIVLVAMSSDRHASPKAASVAPASAGQARQADADQSLELLSMRHAREGQSLSVTGLVRNPGPAAGADILAVVFVFDRDGNFVASGRAPLEFATIGNGDESPFRVTVPDVKDVGRYRVSFRTAAGVVRHVDRRPVVAATAGRPDLQVSAN
jgi:hypothetical protein